VKYTKCPNNSVFESYLSGGLKAYIGKFMLLKIKLLIEILYHNLFVYCFTKGTVSSLK
jgi:hypothetical protein